jgi:hypothetical protein
LLRCNVTISALKQQASQSNALARRAQICRAEAPQS